MRDETTRQDPHAMAELGLLAVTGADVVAPVQPTTGSEDAADDWAIADELERAVVTLSVDELRQRTGLTTHRVWWALMRLQGRRRVEQRQGGWRWRG